MQYTEDEVTKLVHKHIHENAAAREKIATLQETINYLYSNIDTALIALEKDKPRVTARLLRDLLDDRTY